MTAKQAAGLFEMAYSTFMRHLKDFVQNGEYPEGAFWVSRTLAHGKRDRWLIEVNSTIGVAALNRFFFPRFYE